jgi:hypothetical protein
MCLSNSNDFFSSSALKKWAIIIHATFYLSCWG